DLDTIRQGLALARIELKTENASPPRRQGAHPGSDVLSILEDPTAGLDIYIFDLDASDADTKPEHGFRPLGTRHSGLSRHGKAPPYNRNSQPIPLQRETGSAEPGAVQAAAGGKSQLVEAGPLEGKQNPASEKKTEEADGHRESRPPKSRRGTRAKACAGWPV